MISVTILDFANQLSRETRANFLTRYIISTNGLVLKIFENFLVRNF